MDDNRGPMGARHEEDATGFASRDNSIPDRPTGSTGLTLTQASDGSTVIHGAVVDQAALHGLLHKLRDLGLPSVSVTEVEADHGDVPKLEPR